MRLLCANFKSCSALIIWARSALVRTWPFSVGACVDGAALGTVEENPLFAKKLLNGAATGDE